MGGIMICVIFAHPYPGRSRANRALADVLRQVPGLEIRSLYDLYPDFDIDVVAEQAALARAQLIVWMHPVFWYSVPGLLKHWFDQVLAPGWAYGDGGGALQGRHCLWVATTGGDQAAYASQGAHGQAFMSFAAPLQQTARFCGMTWQPPFIVHDAERLTGDDLRRHALGLLGRIEAWTSAAVHGSVREARP
jgi:glutathione-regulated potassium-efflux system ancillary protein KefF